MEAITKGKEIARRLKQVTRTTGLFTISRLKNLSFVKREEVFNVIQSIIEKENAKIKKLIIPTESELEKIDIKAIPLDWISRNCYLNGVLNLSNLSLRLAGNKEEESAMMNASSIVSITKANLDVLIGKIKSNHGAVERKDRYSEDSRIIKIGRFTLEIIDEPDRNLEDQVGNFLEDIKEMNLELYKKDDPSRSEEDIIRSIELSPAEMLKKYVIVSQAQVIKLDGKLVGVMSSILEKVDDYYALYIPVTMMNRLAQGKKLHIRMIYEAAKQALSELIWHQGLIKGIWNVIFRGLPVIVRTNTRKVMLDLKSRSSSFFIPLEGVKPSDLTENVIKKMAHKLGSKLDAKLIARSVYHGKIALKLDKILKLAPEEQKLYDSLGENDAIFAVGYANLLVMLLVGAELKRAEDEEKKEHKKEELKKINLNV
jgi:hypothetical protein